MWLKVSEIKIKIPTYERVNLDPVRPHHMENDIIKVPFSPSKSYLVTYTLAYPSLYVYHFAFKMFTYKHTHGSDFSGLTQLPNFNSISVMFWFFFKIKI